MKRNLFFVATILALTTNLNLARTTDSTIIIINNMELENFDKLWDYNNPAETEKKFREILAKVKPEDDLSYYVQLLTQIARTQGLQRKFEDAHKTLEEAELLLTDDLKLAKVRYLLEKGRVHNSSGKPDSAKPYFDQAFELGKEIGEDFHAIDAMHMIAIVETQEKSLEWNLKAIDFAEKSSDTCAKDWLGSLYNNTGWSLFDVGRYEEALDIFKKSQAWWEEKKQNTETRIAKWCVARTLRAMNKIEEALNIQNALLEEFEKIGEKDGFVFEELGECNLILGKRNSAEKYFKLAYEELSKDDWLVKNEPKRIERLKKLGKVK
jgi:tetratricopeptide (TPR) repeat protein